MKGRFQNNESTLVIVTVGVIGNYELEEVAISLVGLLRHHMAKDRHTPFDDVGTQLCCPDTGGISTVAIRYGTLSSLLTFCLLWSIPNL